MNSLRLNIALLLAWMTVFFNIERLDVGGVDTINLASSVYVVAVVAMLLPLLTFFRRRPVYVTVIPALLLLAVSFGYENRPVVGGFYTYITLVEIILLTGVAVMAHRVGTSLEEFHRAVEIVTLKDKNIRLHSLSDAQEKVETEMGSSRRTQRPLSLLIFQADASSLNMIMHRFVQELQRSMMQRYVLAMTARVLSRHLRRTDLIIEDGKPGRLMLVAPNTSDEHASLLGERLTHLVKDRLGITAQYGVATFPEQALTFDELVTVAEKELRQRGEADSGRELEPDVEVLRLPEART